MIRKLLALLVLSSVLFLSCRSDYVQNKLAIRSFKASFSDSSKGAIAVKFDVAYFSDSSELMGMGHKQMGLDGSNDSMVYFNFKGEESRQDKYGCMAFDSFRNGYNRMLKEYRGQSFDFPFTICANNSEESNDLMLILYNTQSKRTDTLYTLVAPADKD